MKSGRIWAVGLVCVLLAGCSTTKKAAEPMSAEQKEALNAEVTQALKDVSGGTTTNLPPYPAASAIPSESAACKALVEKKRQMSLSVPVINVLQITKQKPWGIFLFDVDAQGKSSNVRQVTTSGMKSIDFDFKTSIEDWQFAPGPGAKNCVAEMRIT